MGRTRNITPADILKIKTFLNLSPNQDFPRCPGKDHKRVKEFEKAGDYDCSSKNHLCDRCRCKRYAGENSGCDDLYGIGVACGHAGTGLCGICRRSARKQTADKMWKDQMVMMQQTGMVTTTEQFEQKALVEANQAVSNLEVKDAIIRVRESIAEFNRLRDGEGLTEKGKDGPQEMSDATRLKLMLEQAKVLNELGKTAFEFSKEMHISMDTMRLWVVDILNLLQKITRTKQEYDQSVREFKSIMAKTRTPTMMMAEHQVSVESMPKAVEHDI